MAVDDLLTLVTLGLAILLVTPVLGATSPGSWRASGPSSARSSARSSAAIYRVCGIDETAEQGWKGYAVSVLADGRSSRSSPATSILRLQDVLPLNPSGVAARCRPTSPSTPSVSFETNTNWQNYSGETGASYLTQTAVLAVRNFTSAATGLAVAIALIRGLTRRSATTIGNFWVDLTRGILYILLPIAFVGALVLVWQGVPQTLRRPGRR